MIDTASEAEYDRLHLKNCILYTTFNNRTINRSPNGDGTYNCNVSTQNIALNELHTHIKDNIWVNYFSACESYIGENWIDFEREISNVIKSIDEARKLVINGKSVLDMPEISEQKANTIIQIQKSSKKDLRNAFGTVKAIDEFTNELNTDLERLIRALEIYLSEIIGKLDIHKISKDIKSLKIDKMLSFNYTDTYKKLYEKKNKIEYDFIHGKANCELGKGNRAG